MGILLRWSYGSFRHWKINGEVMEELKEETFQTEYEIIDLIRMRLYQHRHGLAAVLGAVEIRVSYKAGMFETDGKRLNLDAVRVRERFLEGNDRLCLDILHMLCHCLLGHLCVRERKVRDEKTGGETDTELDLEAWKLAEQIWGESLPFLEAADLEECKKRQTEILHVDSHENWMRKTEQARLKLAFGDQGESTNGRDSLSEKSSQELLDWWMRQSEILKQEIKKKKPKAGMSKRKRVSRRLISSSGHRGDYRTVLQGFSAFREESGINQGEFQYSWYLYGLENYGNMPMIEPLEYREERKISDLVIVIDTSGSCEQDLVRIFLEETKGILEQDQLFFRQFCLYLIQCDNQIQRDDRIENREQFEEYLEHLEIQGGGGTDFCPAFEHIERLRREGELRELKVMLYFTDGTGLYPKKEPDYEVYFVMPEGRYDAIDMPEWIHRLILKAV